MAKQSKAPDSRNKGQRPLLSLLSTSAFIHIADIKEVTDGIRFIKKNEPLEHLRLSSNSFQQGSQFKKIGGQNHVKCLQTEERDGNLTQQTKVQLPKEAGFPNVCLQGQPAA